MTPAPARPRPLSLTLGLALLRRRRSQNLITVLGIAIGVMVLITALSLTNGFSQSLIDATLRATPQLTLTNYQPAPRDPVLEAAIAHTPGVVASGPFLADKGLLIRPAQGERPYGVDFATLFGVLPEEARVLQLRPEEVQLLQNLKPGELVLGSALAQSVGAFAGDRVQLVNSQQKRLALTVRGLFSTGNYLIDSGYAFVRLESLQSLRGSQDISGYHLRLADPQQAPEVGNALAARYAVSPLPWQRLNASLLDQLALQKRVIGFVVFLIVIVAAFGIANVLLLTVFEKTPDIAILRAIGARGRDITGAFVLQGLTLGLLGLLLGDLLGLGLSAYFQWRPFQIPGDLYFISALPVEIRAGDVLWVNLVSLATTLLAALLPARRAANIEPAKIIR